MLCCLLGLEFAEYSNVAEILNSSNSIQLFLRIYIYIDIN